MNTQLSYEMFWLVLTIGLSGLLWLPYIANRIKELGPPSLSWYPQPDPTPKAPWANRTIKAHENAIENLVIFAPLAVIVEVTQSHTELTGLACMGYFVARLAHYLIGITGAPIPFRTIAFLLGVVCQFTLVISLLI